MRHLGKARPPRVTMLLGLLAALFLGLPAGPASAAARALGAAATGQVTIIILDMSGSMSDNDPQGNRCSAANAYIDLSGPGDFVGVIALDGRAGSETSSYVIAPPAEMATAAARQALRQAIAQKTNNCAPDGDTPTANALQSALGMLASATQGGLPGSVILLTDGIPYPDTTGQINTINTTIVPQFKQHGWPVDVVALGPPGAQNGVDFHGFLSGISNATSGNFYDDGHGVVPGVSPLNIAPFFVDIFHLREHRVVGPSIPPTAINGSVSRDFQLSDYIDHLDVIAIHDQPDAQVTLTSPNGTTLPPAVAGTLVSTDPHYAIFSIDGPQAGSWTVTARGPGNLLVDTLTVSSLAVTITSPAVTAPVLPLGQTFTVQANIVYQGSQVTGGQFAVKGTLTYAGDTNGAAPYSQQIDLTDASSPGTYQAGITVPATAPTGTYTLTVGLSQISSQTISSATRSLRLDLFPAPYFLANEGGAPTTAVVHSTVIQYDPFLQVLYGWSPSLLFGIPFGLGQRALQNRPAHPYANIPGQVELSGKAYCGATVQGSATRQGATGSVPITVVNNGCGGFHVQFPPATNGTYDVTFQTSGTYKDSHGDFVPVTRSAELTIQGATVGDELYAWGYTLLYLLILAVIVLLVRAYGFLPAPSGAYEITHGEARPFTVNGGLGRILFQRNRVARPINNAVGLDLLVTRDAQRTGRYLVRAQPTPEGRAWTSENGQPLPSDRYTPQLRVARKGTTYNFIASAGARARPDPVAVSAGRRPDRGGPSQARDTRRPDRGGPTRGASTGRRPRR